MSHLKLSYQPDPSDGFGRLSVAVETPEFSGRGVFWAYVADLEALADALGAYPLDPLSPPTGRWGFNEGEGRDCVIGIQIRPLDRLGSLLADVEIADHTELSRRVRATFTTHYTEVETFGRALRRAARGEAEEAILAGS